MEGCPNSERSNSKPAPNLDPAWHERWSHGQAKSVQIQTNTTNTAHYTPLLLGIELKIRRSSQRSIRRPSHSTTWVEALSAAHLICTPSKAWRMEGSVQRSEE